jgi:non-heme chloroperoxidase
LYNLSGQSNFVPSTHRFNHAISFAMSKQMLSLLGCLVLWGCGIRAQSVPFKVSLPAVQSIQLSTGVNLQYVERGQEHGVPVVLLHGFTDSWHSWELVLPHLPASLHVFAISQRGHGNSDKPLEGYDPKDFAADIAAFLQQKKIKAAIIAGHSMGATIAQGFAADYPERTLGMVLVGAFAHFKENEAIQGFQQVLDTLNDPVEESFAAEFQQSTLGHPIDPEFLQTAINESLKLPARVWKSTAYSLFKADYVDRLRVYTKPVLIVWGDKDVFSPRKDQDLLAGTLMRSQLVIYPGTGHAVHWEEPARFAADLDSFIQQIVPIKR